MKAIKIIAVFVLFGALSNIGSANEGWLPQYFTGFHGNESVYHEFVRSQGNFALYRYHYKNVTCDAHFNFSGQGQYLNWELRECYKGTSYLGRNYWCRGQGTETWKGYEGNYTCNSGAGNKFVYRPQ